MSNRVNIEISKINDTMSAITVYDEYFDTCTISEQKLPDNDISFLDACCTEYFDNDSDFISLMDFVLEHEKGIYIRDTWYDHEEIKETLERHLRG